MKVYKANITMGIGVLLFFLIFSVNAETCLHNENCSRNSDEKSARDIFTERTVERESRTFNVRGKVGSERLVNNRRIVDSDSRLSNFPDSSLSDIGRENTNGRMIKSDFSQRHFIDVQRSTRLGERFKNFEHGKLETNSNRARVTRSTGRRTVEVGRSDSERFRKPERVPTMKNRIRQVSRDSEKVRNSERTVNRRNQSRLSIREVSRGASKIFRNPERRLAEESNRDTERLYAFEGLPTAENKIRRVSYNPGQFRDAESIMTRRNNRDIDQVRDAENVHDFMQTRPPGLITGHHNPMTEQCWAAEGIRNVRNSLRSVNRISAVFHTREREVRKLPNSDRGHNIIITGRRSDLERLPISGYTHNVNIVRNRFIEHSNSQLEPRDFENTVQHRFTVRFIRDRAPPSESERSSLPCNIEKSRIDNNPKNFYNEEKQELNESEVSHRPESERINIRLNLREPTDFEISKNQERRNEELNRINEDVRNRLTKISDSQFSAPQDTRRSISKNAAIRFEENNQGYNVFWSRLVTTFVAIILVVQIVNSKLDSKRFYHIRNLVTTTKEKIY